WGIRGGSVELRGHRDLYQARCAAGHATLGSVVSLFDGDRFGQKATRLLWMFL
ncbi:unnamed protein product, partial [Ectocarpus sp. 13 AM-2016]